MDEIMHKVNLIPGYDHRDDPEGSRSAHGLELSFISQGPRGAISFDIMTGWMVAPLYGPMVRGPGPQRRAQRPGVDHSVADIFPIPDGVYSHTTLPPNDPEREHWYAYPRGRCNLLNVEQCYGMSSHTLLAGDFLRLLVEKGDEAVFAALDELYHDPAWLPGPM